MPYGFRILFRPLGAAIDADDEIALHTGAVVRAPGGCPLREAPARLILRHGGYATEDDARRHGEQHRVALYLSGPAAGYPVDARDAGGSACSDEIKARRLADGVRLLDSPRGLQVFPEDDLENRWIEMSATGTVRRTASSFIDGFAATYASVSSRATSEAERTAVELFNLAHIDSSPRAQFMTYTTVVEVLATPRLRSEAARGFLDACVANLSEARLDAADAEALKNALGSLQRESIATSCRLLVTEHLGSDRANDFRELYRLRGRLTHAGVTDGDLSDCLHRLKAMVAELLMTHFRRPA
jgi:hypothetical protein